MGVAPAFSAKDDIIYFSNAGFKLYRHIFSQNETEEVADIKSMWRMQGFIITVWELIR